MKALKLILSAAVALMMLGGTMSAQGKYTNAELTISKADGRYAKGEKIEVKARLLENKASDLVMTVRVNGKDIIKKEPVELKVGKKTVIWSAAFDEPTSVMVSVQPEDSKDFAKVGAIVAPEEFKPGFEEPADFVEFWQGQVAKLRECGMNPVLTPVEMGEELDRYRDHVDLYDLEINMPEGNPVRAYIAWPKNAGEKSLPIQINPHGAGVRSASMRSAVGKAREGCISVDINAHGILNGQPESYYTELRDGILKDYRTRKSTGHEDFYFRLMYLRMQRLLDYVCTLPQWDGEMVLVDGTSQGGGQALALAGLDSRVKFIVATVPALTDMGGTFAGHSGGWPYYGRFKDGRDPVNVIPYYDGANFIRHTKAKLIMEGGLIDTTCPPECVWAAFNVAGSTDKVMYNFPYREHGTKTMTQENYDLWNTMVSQPKREAILKNGRNR